MDSQNVDALRTFDTLKLNGEKFIIIPLEDILSDRVIIHQNIEASFQPVEVSVTVPIKESIEPDIYIPTEISNVYKNKQFMFEDVIEFLKVTANCWEYHNSEFRKSILKKVSANKPTLNNIMFKKYGKDSDTYLINLITSNLNFIKNCWKNGN